jgi:molybdopterin-containing oxidoreductase family membrane subunit
MFKDTQHIDNREITERLCSYTESKPGKRWKYAFLISVALFAAGVFGSIIILQKGLSVMDINNSVFWGVLITNFVFWIGVSHAGTFISAILLLLQQDWRKAINRSAEAMTIIAIIIAVLMPIIHLGRPVFFYWLVPFSNKTGFYLVNFASPLSWDFYAIASYFILSILFFQMGLLPDLATLRDRSNGKIRKYLYNFFSMGWNGSYKTWQDYKRVMFIFAGLITTLVIAVHSIVSLDFAVTLTSGWHSTLIPIYFVAGAIFSGFAMVGLLAVISSRLSSQKEFLTSRHIENINKIILTTGTLLLIFFVIDVIEIISSGSSYEKINLIQKYTGHYGWISIMVIIFTLLLPQVYWNKKLRQNARKTVIISSFILFGMWLERFMIVVMNAENGFLLSGSGLHQFSVISILMALGCAGLFAMLYLLVLRIIPMISVHESKAKTGDEEII